MKWLNGIKDFQLILSSFKPLHSYLVLFGNHLILILLPKTFLYYLGIKKVEEKFRGKNLVAISFEVSSVLKAMSILFEVLQVNS